MVAVGTIYAVPPQMNAADEIVGQPWPSHEGNAGAQPISGTS
jgi:hypothetical protein